MKLATAMLAGCLILLLISCTNARTTDETQSEQQQQVKPPAPRAQESEMIRKVSAISLPEGFTRMTFGKTDFATFLRAFPIDTTDNIVHLYNGDEKYNQSAQFRILDIDVGNRDLQQCADAVMRLQAEFLFSQGRKEDITFMFTNGDDVPFTKYAEGYRPTVNGNNVSWRKIRAADHSHANFRKYMDLIFSYAGSHSLSRQLEPVADFNSIRPGDVLIQGGFPGHAIIVMDVAIHDNGVDKVFLLAQSYMPAQEIHILNNPGQGILSPWYPVRSSGTIRTPEWTFITDDLMRFSNN